MVMNNTMGRSPQGVHWIQLFAESKADYMTRLTAPLALAVAVLLVVFTGTWISLSHQGNVLLFAAYQDGSFHIFTLDAERDILRRLTAADQNHYDPVWSPDGSQIAYRMSRTIYVMDSGGFNAYALTQDESLHTDFPPVWSPDGSQIAIATRTGDIGVIDVYDGTARNLTNTPNSVERHPVWSPDGREIAFDMAHDAFSGIYIMDMASGDLHSITPESLQASTPRWSNTRIAFDNRTTSTAQTLLTADLVTNEIHDYAIQTSLNADYRWSPDGTQIAFVGTTSPTDSGIYMIDVASGAVTPIISLNDQIDTLTWSPDGTQIAFRAKFGQGFALYGVEIATGEMRLLVDTDSLVFSPTWRP